MPYPAKDASCAAGSPWEAELQRVIRALRDGKSNSKSQTDIADVLTWLNQVCRALVDVGGYRMACVAFAEHDAEKSVRVVAAAGNESGYFQKIKFTWADEPRGRGAGGIAIRTGKPCIARDLQNSPQYEPWRDEILQRGYKSSIALPLNSKGRTFGLLGIYSDAIDAFDPAEVDALQSWANGLAAGLTVVLRTRAQRHAAIESLKESQLKLADAQRIAHVGHWERDLKTNVIKWSDELFRIFGMTPRPTGFQFEEFIEFVHAEDRPRILPIIAEMVRIGQHYDVEFRIVRRNGQVRFVHAEGDAFRDETGRSVRTFGIVQDITERRVADQALKKAHQSLELKNIAMQEVLASIAAERRTIGRQIDKNVQKIIHPLIRSLKQGLSPEQKRCIEQIEHALNEVTSPFIDKLSRAAASLTPAELRITEFVRRGLAVKEIAVLEHLSPQTVSAHRRSIRRKLGISNQKVNLTTHLRTIFANAIPAPR